LVAFWGVTTNHVTKIFDLTHMEKPITEKQQEKQAIFMFAEVMS
jgi:hypothetical protein